MTIKENIGIALNSIRGNALRAVITALIISLGIMALVGILTAIDGIKASINSNFSSMGANTFNIKNKGQNIHFSGKNKQQKRYKTISYNEAKAFANEFQFPATVSMSVNASWSSTIKHESLKTDPNVMVMGADANYLSVAGYEIERGRNFQEKEINHGINHVLIGKEIKQKLFRNKEAVGEFILIGGAKFKIIGVLKEKGSSMGFGGDRLVIVPIDVAYQAFSMPNMSSVITVMVKDALQINFAIEEASSLFRKVRKLPVFIPNNFEVFKADSVSEDLIGNLKYVTMAASIIGLITLLGAAVGLMNIMLVSVTERTREIGIRKAIGATSAEIKKQFLIEAIVICQIGGLGGIILGISIGNIVSALVGGGFIVPWLWMGSGIVLCILVGLISGIYPAIKASKLDPIEALRFE
jgi:putative ABC transport system permease protein